MKKSLVKAVLFSLAFLAVCVSPAFAVTNFTTVAGNTTTAPVNRFELNFTEINATSNVTQVNFTLSTGLGFVGTGNATNSSLTAAFFGSTISFGNNTTNSSSKSNSFAFNISSNSSGLFNITVTEVNNATGVVVTNVTLNITNGTIILRNDTFANFTYNGTSLTLNFTGTPSALTPTGGGTIIDNITFMLYVNGTIQPVNYTNATTNGTGSISYTNGATAGLYLFVFNTSGDGNYSLNSTAIALNISQAVPTLNIFVNNSSSNASVTYPAPVELRGNATLGNATSVPSPDFNIYIINTSSSPSVSLNASGNPSVTTQVLGNGTYQVIYNTSGNANYTSASNNALFLNVSKGTLYLSLSAPNVTYPNNTVATSSETNIGDADVNYTLYLNASGLVNFSSILGNGNISQNISLGAVSYLYTLNTTSATFANWTANTTDINNNVIVSQGITNLTLSISPSTSVTNPTPTSVNASGCPTQGAYDVNCTFWRDNKDNNFVLLSSANHTDPTTLDPNTFGVGTWTYTYNSTVGANWTANSTTATLTVSAASSTPPNNGGGGNEPTPPASSTRVTVTRGNANITVPSIAASKMANVTIIKTDGVDFRQINISVVNSVNNIKIVITKLAGEPASVTHTIEGKVYHYIEVDNTNFTDSDVSKVFIKFAVNKTWLSDNGVDKTNVSLYRWANDKWNELPTTYLSEDSYEDFYQTESPGLSYFLIGTSGGEVIVPQAPAPCVESWTCTAWSVCANNQQTRTCTDANACGTTASKLPESQGCVPEAVVTAPSYAWMYYTIAAIIIIAVAAVLFIFRKKIIKK